MTGYTKLFSSILASTIWREDDKTRIVWITLLAMANKFGVAEGSVPGLADLARVTVSDCEAALSKLEAPDKYSRTKTDDGRRIRAVDGGWLILNHAKYRAKMNQDDRREYNRLKQAEWRAKHHNACQTPVSNRNQMSALSAQSKAAPEAKASPTGVQGVTSGNGAVTLELVSEPTETGAVAPVASRRRTDLDPEALTIYEAYPRHVGRKPAMQAITNALRKTPAQDLLAKTQAFAAAVSRWPAGSEQFVPHPATWFNQERFLDDPKTWERIAPPTPTNGATPAWKARQDLENQITAISEQLRFIQDPSLRRPYLDQLDALRTKHTQLLATP